MSLLGYLGAGLGAAFGGWNIAEGFIGRKWQERQIAEDRQFQQDMYQRQLDDSIDWRTHTEQYNSPEAQMKRYADAGVNPMYAITGTGGNAVAQPFSTATGSHSSNPQPVSSKSNIDALALANLKKIENEASLLNSQSKYWNNMSNLVYEQIPGQRYSANIFRNLEDMGEFWKDREGQTHFTPSYEMEAQSQYTAIKWYNRVYQRMSFEDAVAQLEHSKLLREFEADLSEHQRSQFQYELSNCKNASEMFTVMANWARANQWINAASNLTGAVCGVVGAFKGTAALPTTSQSLTPPQITNQRTFNNHGTYNYTSNYTRSSYY